jgi:hypothetical protein
MRNTIATCGSCNRPASGAKVGYGGAGARVGNLAQRPGAVADAVEGAPDHGAAQLSLG